MKKYAIKTITAYIQSAKDCWLHNFVNALHFMFLGTLAIVTFLFISLAALGLMNDAIFNFDSVLILLLFSIVTWCIKYLATGSKAILPTMLPKYYDSGTYQLYKPNEPIDINKENIKFKKSSIPLLVIIFWVVRTMVGV